MTLKQTISALAIVFLFCTFTYLVTVSKFDKMMDDQVDGLREIAFIDMYRIHGEDVWIKFEDEHSHWRSTARSVAIYLSRITSRKITVVVGDGRQVTLSPKLDGLCHVVADRGVVDDDTCTTDK